MPEVQEEYICSHACSHKDASLRIEIGSILHTTRCTGRKTSFSVAVKETLIGFLRSYHWFKQERTKMKMVFGQQPDRLVPFSQISIVF